MGKVRNCVDQPVYWMLGLPFDVVDYTQAIERIDEAIATRERLIFATPNTNFVSLASRSDDFRRNVLRTGLSLVDGMPLVWIGRLIGIPFPQRVAGSTLIERLLARGRDSRVRLYFFGGQDGVGEAACRRINALDAGIVAVGAYSPGFGRFEDLGGDQTIAEINRAAADFLLVALGAEKGHAWIERNQSALDAPVISHLGASLHFSAGTLRRAPGVWQTFGFEWLWRIGQEPKLTGRYLRDVVYLVSECVTTVAPQVWRRLFRRHATAPSFASRWAEDSSRTLHLGGSLLARDIEALYRVLSERGAAADGEIRIDLSGVESLDSRSIGFLYQLRYRNGLPCGVSLTGQGPKLARLLRLYRADALLQ